MTVSPLKSTRPITKCNAKYATESGSDSRSGLAVSASCRANCSREARLRDECPASVRCHNTSVGAGVAEFAEQSGSSPNISSRRQRLS